MAKGMVGMMAVLMLLAGCGRNEALAQTRAENGGRVVAALEYRPTHYCGRCESVAVTCTERPVVIAWVERRGRIERDECRARAESFTRTAERRVERRASCRAYSSAWPQRVVVDSASYVIGRSDCGEITTTIEPSQCGVVELQSYTMRHAAWR